MTRSMMRSGSGTTPYFKTAVILVLVVVGVFVIMNIDSGPSSSETSSGAVVQEEAVVEMAVKQEIQEEAEQKEVIREKKVKSRKEKPRVHDEPPVADGNEDKAEQVAAEDGGMKDKESGEAKPTTEAGAKTLADIASEVAVNNIVVYTVVGEGHVHIYQNWVLSFIHAIGDPERHNFLAFAKSSEIYEELEKMFPGHAFYLSSEAEEAFLDKVDEKDYDRESRNAQLAYIRRPLYAMMLLQLGYDAVYANVDAVFIRNPLRGLKGGEYEVYLAYNDWGELPKKTDPHARTVTPYEKDAHSISGSFLYFRNSPGAKHVLSAWLKAARSLVLAEEKKELTDEILLNRAFWSNINYNLAQAKIGALPMYAFPAAHVYFGLKVGKKDNERPWRDVFKKDVQFVETSWLTDMEGKVQSLKDLKLWHVGESPSGSG